MCEREPECSRYIQVGTVWVNMFNFDIAFTAYAICLRTYHPPKPTYTSNDFMQYLINIVDNALEKQPGMAIVVGGDVNQLKISELYLMTGWEALVDFPTRGEAILDNRDI